MGLQVVGALLQTIKIQSSMSEETVKLENDGLVIWEDILNFLEN